MKLKKVFPFVEVNKKQTGLEKKKDEEKSVKNERGNWPHHSDFILSCVGYAVGFGSIWRFPYLCMKNGGGAFLIPYLLFMVLCGMPLFLLELSMGQYCALSPIALMDFCPLIKGVGWAMLAVSGVVTIYYNVILTWVIYYLGYSFTGYDVPWKSCDNSWNTEFCRTSFFNISSNGSDANASYFLPSEEFWTNNVLNLKPDINLSNMGQVNGILCLCLFLSWLIVYLCVCKGVESVGKVVYFTATAPYFFFFVLLIRNCLLEGSGAGLTYFIKPDFSLLKNPNIWTQAALQVFFSLGPGWGGLITLSSFNKFKANVIRDSIMISAINFFTSILGGLVIFAVLGYMALKTGKEIKEFVSAGPALVFVAYPEAISHMPFSAIWSVFFFLMLITIGLDSQFGMFETVVNSLIDNFSNVLRPRKTLFISVCALLEFIIAIPFVTQGGIYLFTLFDWYAGTVSLSIITFLELVCLVYLYGIERHYQNIDLMINKNPGIVFRIIWKYITPVMLIYIFISSFVSYANPSYGAYEYPAWGIALGWCLAIGVLIPIPIMFYRVYTTIAPGTHWKTRIKIMTQPLPIFDNNRQYWIEKRERDRRVREMELEKAANQ